MASTRKKGPGSARSKKMAAFLKDFDREVRSRQERMRADGEQLVKKMENMYDMEVLRLPAAIRKMNWLSFFARGGSKKALEEAVTADLEISKIDKLTAEVIQTPLKVIKKGKSKQCIEAVGETAEPPLAKKAKHTGQCPVELGAENSIQRTEKVGASTKKMPLSRSKRPPSAALKRLSKRASKNSFITPATGRSVDFCTRGGTAMVTPRFDSRVFKTPGLRTPAANEHVYTISANGSPLAESGDVFISVPIGGGESIRLGASDLTKKNFVHLNAETQSIVKTLSVRLAKACSGAGAHK